MKDYKLERLSELPLFAHLDSGRMRRLAAIADEITVRRGTTLTATTDRTTDFFVIEEGRAVRQSSGRPLELVTGDFFGELPADHTHDTPASETIEAVTDLRMLVIRRNAFPLLNEIVPGLTGTLAEAVALHSGF